MAASSDFKDKEKIPAVDGSDEEGSQSEEEYEIEAILAHQASKAKRGWEYLVSWVGYGPEHNSWVAETDFGSHELIDEYWKAQGGKPVKTSNRGRQAKSAAVQPTASTSSRKRRGVSQDDNSIDVDKPTPSKRQRGANASADESTKDNGDDETFQLSHVDPMDAYKDLADWEDKVASIETIERGANNNLVVYMVMVGGEKTAQDTETVYKRCPIKMLHFYESHLKWRAV